MSGCTKEKYEKFGKSFGVSKELLQKHYRVFVPYNN
jgi:hypothetical protein